MGLDAKENQKTQKPLIPEGPHVALLWQIVDLGTQQVIFNNEAKSMHKISLGFEFQDHMHTYDEKVGPQPISIFQEYTFSLNPKANFRKMMDSWIKKPVTSLSYEKFQKLLGRSALITVEHGTSKDGKLKYNNISFKGIGVSKRPDSMDFPKKTLNEPLLFALDHFSWETFDRLNKFTQEKIRKSEEWAGVIAKYPQPNTETQGSEHSLGDEDSGIAIGNEEEDAF